MESDLCYVAPMALTAVGISLNAAELIVLYQKTITAFDTLIISLAFCDQFSCVSLFICIALVEYFAIDLGKIFFSISYGILTFFHACALGNTWIITFNRMIAVVCPLKSLAWMTKSRTIRILIIMWTVCVLIMAGFKTLQYYLSSVHLMSRVIAPLYALTFCMLLISYSVIFRQLKTTNYNIQRSIDRASQNSNPALSVKRSLQEKRLALLSFRIVTSFMICSMPYLVIFSVFKPSPISFCKSDKKVFFATSIALLLLNTVVDPLFYFYMQRHRDKKTRDQIFIRSLDKL